MTPMTKATVVFLIRAMKVEPIGAIEPRKACGSTTSRRDCLKVRPTGRAASACPTGTVFRPERRALQTKAAW